MPEMEQPNDISVQKSKRITTVKICSTVIAFIVALSIVVFFIKRIFFLKKNRFDLEVFVFLKQHVSPRTTSVMECFTWLGSQYFLIPAFILLMLYFFLILKKNWLGMKVVVISVGSLLVMFGLKMLFQRPRPEMPLLHPVEGLSFPSGHAFMSFSFFGLLIYLMYKARLKRWKRYTGVAVLTFIMLMIGISRIYLRVHYASDVIAGFCMGFMWMVISLVILHQLEKRRTRV